MFSTAVRPRPVHASPCITGSYLFLSSLPSAPSSSSPARGPDTIQPPPHTHTHALGYWLPVTHTHSQHHLSSCSGVLQFMCGVSRGELWERWAATREVPSAGLHTCSRLCVCVRLCYWMTRVFTHTCLPQKARTRKKNDISSFSFRLNNTLEWFVQRHRNGKSALMMFSFPSV